jgi:hypothetical protein
MEEDNSLSPINIDEDDVLSIEACLSFYDQKSIDEKCTMASSIIELFGFR